jgi:hypothetical protein
MRVLSWKVATTPYGAPGRLPVRHAGAQVIEKPRSSENSILLQWAMNKSDIRVNPFLRVMPSQFRRRCSWINPQMPLRNIHAGFGLFLPQKAHGYCIEALLSLRAAGPPGAFQSRL